MFASIVYLYAGLAYLLLVVFGIVISLCLTRCLPSSAPIPCSHILANIWRYIIECATTLFHTGWHHSLISKRWCFQMRQSKRLIAIHKTWMYIHIHTIRREIDAPFNTDIYDILFAIFFSDTFPSDSVCPVRNCQRKTTDDSANNLCIVRIRANCFKWQHSDFSQRLHIWIDYYSHR